MSSAISTTDKTEEPNQRLHWLPRLDRRVTICKEWGACSPRLPRSLISVLPAAFLPRASHPSPNLTPESSAFDIPLAFPAKTHPSEK